MNVIRLLMILLIVPFLHAGQCSTTGFSGGATEPPRDCEELARPSRSPEYADDEDFRLIAEKYKRQADGANWRLSATRKCLRDVREAGQKK